MMKSHGVTKISIRIWLLSAMFVVIYWIAQSKIEGFVKGEPVIIDYFVEYIFLIIISYIRILMYTIPLPFVAYIVYSKLATMPVPRYKKIIISYGAAVVYSLFTAFYIVEGILRFTGWRGEDNPDNYFYWFYLFAPLSAVTSLLLISNNAFKDK